MNKLICLLLILCLLSGCTTFGLKKGQGIYLREDYGTDGSEHETNIKYTDFFVGTGGFILTGVALYFNNPLLNVFSVGLGTLSLLSFYKTVLCDFEIREENK